MTVFAAGYWLLHTSPGSRWIWDRVTSAVPGELGAAAVDGSLAGGLRLTDVSFRNPSLELTVSQARLTVDLDLFPPSVDIVELNVDDTVVRQRERPPPDEPAGDFSLESLILPVELDIHALNVRKLRVLGPEGDALFAVANAELAGRWHEAIALSRLQVDSSTGNVRGSAALALSAPFAASASIAAGIPLQLGEGPEVPLRITANAEGNLGKLRIDVTSDEPNLVVEGALTQLIDEPAWDLRVRSPYLQWPLTSPSPDLRLSDVVLDSSGSLAEYSVKASGTVAATADEELGFSLVVDGDRDSLEVARLALRGPMLNAVSAGELRWEDGVSVTVNADIERFDPSLLTAEWPAGTPVSGAARGALSAGRMELQEVRLRVLETGQTVDATGRVDLEQGVVDLNLDWRDLKWPIEAGKARFRSEFGNVTVTGKPDAWALAGRIAFAMPELPQGTFELFGTGNRDEMALRLADSQVLGGRIAGQVDYRWRDGGRWSAELTAASIETAPLLPDWPGSISADFVARGQVEPLEIELDIDRLAGRIRDRPVQGTGGIRYANGNLAARQLQISSGDSLLEANGRLQSPDGLDFALEIASLATLVRGSAGSLAADGNLSLEEGLPELRMNLEGRDLAWRDYRLESLRIEAPDGASAPLAFTAEGRALEIGARQIEEFRIEFAGSDAEQQLAVTATLDEKRVEIGLDGQFADWQRPLESGWAGRLQVLNLQTAEGANFSLDDPAALRLDNDLAALERACLLGNGASRICLEGRRARSDFAVSAELSAVPVNLVKLLLDTELEFTQTLDGSLEVSDAAGRELSAQARVNISPGQIRSPDNSRIAMRTRAGVFNLDLDDGQVLSGRFTLPFSDTAAIDARFAVADVAMGSESRVRGDLSVNLNDIGVATGIAPSIESANGRLDVDIALTGTLAEPLFFGQASLTNGGLSYAPMGLKLTDIELNGRILEGNRLDLQSTFRAGKGTGRIYSSADSLNVLGDGVELRLTGDNLTVIDLPQVNVVADMELDFAVTQEELSINGDVLIPRARLSPREITSGRVGKSDDVVIVASREGEPEEQNESPPAIAITGQVDLALGEDVIVQFEAAETRLSDSANFVWTGPPMPTATGEYKVAGKFEAYGQLLEITEGSIRFPGVPATNPLLRIRAEREIFGNSRIRSAGVLVSGTAKNPELEVYTNPPTNKERALTMLVTGSDFNYEQGVGAVDVGTYIAPDLYLSYGIGLFDRENVISVRYDLARGFGIKATSGKRAEGIDLSYTFER